MVLWISGQQSLAKNAEIAYEKDGGIQFQLHRSQFTQIIQLVTDSSIYKANGHNYMVLFSSYVGCFDKRLNVMRADIK